MTSSNAIRGFERFRKFSISRIVLKTRNKWRSYNYKIMTQQLFEKIKSYVPVRCYGEPCLFSLVLKRFVGFKDTYRLSNPNGTVDLTVLTIREL